MYVHSTITGIVAGILTEVGTAVRSGDQLFIVQSMKMEIPFESPAAGTVLSLSVATGEPVNEGDVVAEIG